MVRFPAYSLDELGLGWPKRPHPAFVLGGAVKPYVYIGKYEAYRVGSGTTARALSLRGLDPTTSITFDDASAACRQKGTGWHLMTNAEWAAVALWCWAKGYMPRGNSNYSQSSDAPAERGAPACIYSNLSARVATGSGPMAWSHDGSPYGIWDLNGNVWEWVAGYRLVAGEIQIIKDNDAAAADLSAASTAWQAILQDGSLVAPGTADTLKWDSALPQDDDGVVDVAGKPQLNTTLANPAPATWGDTTYQDYNYSTFDSPLVATGVAVPDILKQLAIYPHAASLAGDGFWSRNYGERVALRGGDWNVGSSAGVFALGLYVPRSYVNVYIGFRPAFVA
ncbi:MAG: SUMF1/EgtB/PvdO family nonheme iron enzyme [Firmicutes bacterium]|nr:SUMF1/EgtB/PvdO family nonheme iron enzyme [Bacillota bacterium]